MSGSLAFNRFHRALWLFLIIGLLASAALTLWISLSAIFFPYQLDDGEGLMLEFTRLVAQGQPLFKSLFAFPYMPSNYPPVAMFLAAPFYTLFGPRFAPGRILTLAALIFSTFLLYQFARHETKRRAVAAIISLLFIGSTFVYHWAPLFRVDLIGLAFSLGGVYFVWQWEQDSRQPSAVRRQIRLLGLALICFVLAVYTKYTLVAAPTAACLAVWLRSRRAGIIFALTLMGIGGTIFLAGNLITHGALWDDLIIGNASIWLWDTFARIFGLWLRTYLVVIVLGVWELIRRVRERKIGVLEIYFLATLLTILFSGRIGAWENYYFEVTAMACVFAGCQIGNWRPAIGNWIMPLLLIVQLLLYIPEHDPRVALSLMSEIDASNRALAPILTATPGPILAEDVGALIQTNHSVVYYPFLYSSLARGGRWDQSWELSNLRAGTFPLVILDTGTRVNVDNYQRFTHAFASALDANYALSETLGRYELYRPAPLEHSAAFNFEDKLALVAWSAPSVIGEETRTLTVSLLWQARANLDTRFTAFVHLEDAQGAVLAQDDHEPRGGAFPTTQWMNGDKVREVYSLAIKQRISPRIKYFLRVGWYDTLTKERISVGNADVVTVEEIDVLAKGG